MEWYIHRTATKLPGAFDSDFWSTLLPRASSSEPAVLHALLTLASVHKRQVLDLTTCADTSELFALQHYTRATGDLRRRIESQSKTSAQVALIACAIFVQLEYLKGCYQTALTHLRHGFGLLDDLVHVDNNLKTGGHKPVEAGILQIFTTLFIQARLLGQEVGGPRPLLLLNQEVKPVDGTFQSARHARQSLEYTLLRVFDMVDQTRREGSVSSRYQMSPADFGQCDRTANLQIELDAWPEACETTMFEIRKQPRTVSTALALFGLRLLRIYHTMACVMLTNCSMAMNANSYCFTSSATTPSMTDPQTTTPSTTDLPASSSSSRSSEPPSPSPSSFTISHKPPCQLQQPPSSPTNPCSTKELLLFQSIVDQSNALYELAYNPLQEYKAQHQAENYGTSTSIADMGWIAPLYFTAMNGPTPKIRREAIRILHASPHREGIFDAILVAAVAERVLEIEEKGGKGWYHHHHHQAACCQAKEVVAAAAEEDNVIDLDLKVKSPLPLDKWCSVRDIQVELPEGHDGILSLKYSICNCNHNHNHDRINEHRVMRKSVYDLKTHQWTGDYETSDTIAQHNYF